MATFGYGRVSTAEQTPDNQRLELEQAGHRIDYWIADRVSGKVPARARKEFASLLERIRDGETLVVSKLDRLGRDALDVHSTIRLLLDRNIRVVVQQLGGMDLGSTAGKIMVAVLAAVAEMERDLIVERTRAGLARVRAEGKHVGRPPRVTPDQRAAIVARLAAGATHTELAREYSVSRALVYKIQDAAQAVTVEG